MKYNYIIYGNSYPYYSVAYSDLKKNDNVKYIKEMNPLYGGKLIRAICRFVFNKKINKIINIPFKTIFGKYYVPKEAYKKDNLCFIFMIDFSVIRVMPYLKKRLSNAKRVFYAQDILKKSGIDDIPAYLKQFDMVISYDKGDAEKYGMFYYPTPFTIIPINEDKKYQSDIYYLGIAKDRLPSILNAFDYFSHLGLKCRFIIFGDVSYEIKCRYKDITFTQQLIPYHENLKYVRNTKCILEFMQKGAVGITPRVWEAIGYDKILITNNYSMIQTSVYNSHWMRIINDETIKEINKDFIIQNSPKYSEQIKKTMSPINLISYIDAYLSSGTTTISFCKNVQN